VKSASFPAQARATIRRYLKWYAYPLIYFLVTSLICIYAWYSRPVPYRAGIKTVFKKISLLPTFILTGTITVWIIIAIILIPILLWLKKRFPNLSVHIKPEDYSQKDILREPSSNTTPMGFWKKTLKVSFSVLGVILIVAGLSIAAWNYRPYITFLFSTSKIEALEKKAELLGQAQGDVIKKSEALQKTAELPIKTQRDVIKEKGVSEQESDFPGKVQRDESKMNVPVDPRAEVREQVERVAASLEKDLIRQSEAMEKAAEGSSQSKENTIIIPTALIHAPILEGIDMEKLSEGVCHNSKSAVPGKGGNCIIEGHNLGEFGWWRPQGPFKMLEILEKGVRIYVFYNGKKYVYKVKEKIYTDVNDPKLYDFSPGERLTLITCTSTWNPTLYTVKRIVITAYPEPMK